MNDETTQDNADAMQEGEEVMSDDWAEAFAEQAQTEATGGFDAKPAPMQELLDEGVPPSDDDVNLDVILDIPVTIAMEIGRTRINIRNLLQLNQGSVVELDRLAGEPLDVLVNGTLIAHGEVVVVNEKYGIRLTDVISAAERVKKLK